MSTTNGRRTGPTPRLCSIDGCELVYGYWKRYGDPLATPQRRGARALTADQLARLRAQVGLPPEGPTDKHQKRWHGQEASA